ncbi:MAG: zf-HC2 domain-containing protein [bacterium]|nr:zf-HC2 domain-containing protein [bacterium]
MRHLDDENIAGMIDGTINKNEREEFTRHLAECKECFSIYTETLKFIEEEEKQKMPVTLPRPGKLAEGFRQKLISWFPPRILIPVAVAAVLIFAVALPYFFREDFKEAKTRYVEKNLLEWETYSFSPGENGIYAAARAGMLTEYLLLISNNPEEEELRSKTRKLLSDQLLLIAGNETGTVLPDPEDSDGIRAFTKKRSLSRLFELGRFVEQSMFSAIAGNTPDREDIAKFLQPPKPPEHHLPPIILAALNTLNTTDGVNQSKMILTAIQVLCLGEDK